MGYANSKAKQRFYKFTPFIQYRFVPRDDGIQELIIKNSTLRTQFKKGREKGVFAKNKIKKGAIVMASQLQYTTMINDAMVDFNDVLNAKTSLELFEALMKLYSEYYNLERAQQLVNVARANYKKQLVHVAIRDIEEGEELLMVYGIDFWVKNYDEFVTPRNFPGYNSFLKEIHKEYPTDNTKLVEELDKLISFTDEIMECNFPSARVAIDAHERDFEGHNESIYEYLIDKVTKDKDIKIKKAVTETAKQLREFGVKNIIFKEDGDNIRVIAFNDKMEILVSNEKNTFFEEKEEKSILSILGSPTSSINSSINHSFVADPFLPVSAISSESITSSPVSVIPSLTSILSPLASIDTKTETEKAFEENRDEMTSFEDASNL
jgi:hypothetical protein